MKKKFSPITGGRYTEVPSRDRYEPDSYDDVGTELPEEEIKLTVPIDDTFIIDGSSDIEESKETKYDWALQDGSSEAWYVEIDNYDITIRNSEEIIDDALSVLIDNLPYKAGKYHVTCTVTLIYRVSGIVTWEYQIGPSYHSERYDEDFADYDSGIDTEDMDVELVFGKSYVSNLKTEIIK